MISAISQLAHNGRLIENAERTLANLAANENCFIYLCNSDGTRVRIMQGVRIESYEMVVPSKEKYDEQKS